MIVLELLNIPNRVNKLQSSTSGDQPSMFIRKKLNPGINSEESVDENQKASTS